MDDANKACCGPTCCGDDGAAKDTREVVREAYGKVGEGASGAGCCTPSGCKGTMTAEELATRIGYSPEELRALPEGSNLGLSCGNPTAIAALRPGQVVLDLGSGGGFDCFVSGPKVGAAGRVVGVDMTPQMIARARRNLESYRSTTGLDNVEFRLGEIEHLPVADASVDVVISNCVINLSPDKPQVWREIARTLRPGGRVAASDIALLRPLPDEVRGMVEALVGCVAGAVLLDEYRAMVEAAGLADVKLTPKPEYVASLAQFEDPLYRRIAEALPMGTTAADFLTSVDVTARKRA
jgi:SAM-dependent methyltransferase